MFQRNTNDVKPTIVQDGTMVVTMRWMPSEAAGVQYAFGVTDSRNDVKLPDTSQLHTIVEDVIGKVSLVAAKSDNEVSFRVQPDQEGEVKLATKLLLIGDILKATTFTAKPQVTARSA